MLSLLSPGYFKSNMCCKEIVAANTAGIPVVSVFSGEDYTRKKILALQEEYRSKAVDVAFQQAPLDIRDEGAPCVGKNHETLFQLL